MDSDSNKVRSLVNEDRLSGLPTEIIHQILSRFDTKFAVQTCVLSSRWEHTWKSMTCLNLSSRQFDSLHKFAEFVNHVLSHRNHQVDVSLVKIYFHGAANQVFVGKIADYLFSHNVQKLTIRSSPMGEHHEFPSRLFSSQTLKHLSFSCYSFPPCLTPKTPWDFPALTTLYLNEITLGDENDKSVDLFSKCVSLKNLTLETFFVYVEVFDIITPRLSNLTLIGGYEINAINVVAPQLKSLTVSFCLFKYLNVPSGISSLCYKGYHPPQWSFLSVYKVSVSLSYRHFKKPYDEKDAREIIKMLQELHSAKHLNLDINIIECISSFSEIVSNHSSPFSNLVCLNIDSSMRADAHKVIMSTEARSFFLKNSPDATFIMDPEPPLTKAMNEKLVSCIISQAKELQASAEEELMLLTDRKWAKEMAKTAIEHFVVEQRVLTNMMQSEPEKVQSDEVEGLIAQTKVRFGEMHDLAKQDKEAARAIYEKKYSIEFLLEKLPKLRSKEMNARYSLQFKVAESLFEHLFKEFCISDKTVDVFEKMVSDFILAFERFSGSKLPMASQLSSSSEIIPAPSASSINPKM